MKFFVMGLGEANQLLLNTYHGPDPVLNSLYIYIYICLPFVFCPFKAAPAAYECSQARGLIRAVAGGLCWSRRNARSQPRLRPTPQLTATPDL